MLEESGGKIFQEVALQNLDGFIIAAAICLLDDGTNGKPKRSKPPMASSNNNTLSGLLFCAFPIGVFAKSFFRPVNMELGGWAILVLFFITGINLFVTGVFKLENKVVARAVTGGIYGLGFGITAILIGGSAKSGWSGNWENILPDSWTQTIPRVMFLVGGIACCVWGGFSFRNAYRKLGRNNDEESNGFRLTAEADEARRTAAWKADPKGRKTTFALLFFIILVTAGPGLACLGIGGHHFFISWQSKHWAQAAGVVKSVKVETSNTADSDGNSRTVHRLLMDYDYSVAGKNYTGHRVSAGDSGDEAYAQASRYPAGMSVIVHYAPSNPASALLEQRVGGAELPLLFAGVVFSTVGAMFIVSLIKAWRLR